jgi:hypothetical protein
MRKLPVVIAISQFAISAAAAQSQSAAPKAELLSLDQETTISQLIANQTVPLSSGSFSIALEAVVPAKIQVYSLPSEVEQLAPQLRGFGMSLSKNKSHSLISGLARSRSYFRNGGSSK